MKITPFSMAPSQCNLFPPCGCINALYLVLEEGRNKAGTVQKDGMFGTRLCDHNASQTQHRSYHNANRYFSASCLLEGPLS